MKLWVGDESCIARVIIGCYLQKILSRFPLQRGYDGRYM